MQTACVAGADRSGHLPGDASALGSPPPLILQFTVKVTRERQTRIVERLKFESPGVLVIERGTRSESVILDSIEDLAIARNPALRRLDGTPCTL